MMAKVQLTKRIEFAAAHRYHNEAWDAARNRQVFGACNNAPGHGHNYMLEVTVAGEVDPHTGMVVNLYNLKQVLKQVLEEFDHKHLNLDTPYFKEAIPTTENVAGVLWRILSARPEIGKLERVRLYEDDDLSADITAADATASLTRRYYFSAAHRLQSSDLSEHDQRRLAGTCGGSTEHGHNYRLEITVDGTIDPQTGMVTDVPALDRIVREHVLQRFDHRELNEDVEFSDRMATGENLARVIWDLLVKAIPAGRLQRIGVGETREVLFEYGG
jgi:6-pyruvoyltetrahydropterin/6-carboxytetrahydropterin synthase